MKAIDLKKAQKDVMYLNSDNPVQIKGVAGSGKSTIAVYRAEHLLKENSGMFEQFKVAIFTYNKTLVQHLKNLYDNAFVSQNSFRGIKDNDIPAITNFHKWAYHFISDYYKKNKINTIQSKMQREIINEIKKKYLKERIANKSTEFFLEEISWIKGKMINSLNEYKSVTRVNRGQTDRVTQKDREVIWQILVDYSQALKRMNYVDFDDYALICYDIIKKNLNFVAPFNHLIIDEAQDLNKAQIKVLSMLVDSNRMGITIIADSAQRIYKSGFSWSEVGINVQGGRTVELHKNYRNTIHIARAAVSLLEKDIESNQYTKVETARNGSKKPIVGNFNNSDEQSSFLIKEINKIKIENELGSIAILHRNTEGLRQIEELLTSNKINSNNLREYSQPKDKSVNICTMSSIKGLEFDHVFVIDLNEEIIPLPAGFSEENDENHISTERRLLYTSMTRARESLYLLSSAVPSRYLSEIDDEYVDRV